MSSTAPVPAVVRDSFPGPSLALVARLHVDLQRVQSAVCRAR